MPLVKRIVEISVKLASNSKTNQPSSFSESGSDTVTLAGSRTSARIRNSGAPGGSTASVDVYGLTPSLMNQMATLGLVFNIVPKNTILIRAGDAASGLSNVFSGTITAGYGDYEAAPDVPFHFECMSGLADAVAPTPASSFTGSTSVATIMRGIAGKMGVGFENNGVTAQLQSPYFDGNLTTQMRECAQHAGVNAELVDGKLCIWPKGGNRSTPSPYLIAPPPAGQMVGYPAYTQQGIIVRNVFAPQITFGGLVKVQTSLKQIDEVGTWAVNKLDLALDSLVPRGQWMSTIHAYNPKYPKPIPGGS